MSELRIGVIGMGKMGLMHAGILNALDGVKIQAIADTENMITKFIKKTIPGIETYDDYKKMIDRSELDAVYITTPVASHIPIASFCAQKNLHFFVEKPLGRTSSECLTLCNLVMQSKIVNMVGFYLRYADTFKKAKELLCNNLIGEVKSITSSVYQTQILSKAHGWRFKKEISGGGILIDLGSHMIDLLVWYFGKVKSVQ